MRMATIALVLVLLGGCAIVPLDYYSGHGRFHRSSCYGFPGNGDEGYRHHGYRQGRAYNYRGDYGYPR